MGYHYSHVAAVIRPAYPNPDDVAGVTYDELAARRQAHYSALKLFMNTTFAETYALWEKSWTWCDALCELRFEHADIKWYPSYQDVQAAVTFFNEVAELGYSVGFARIGEDSNDVEEWELNNAWGEALVGVQKSIEFASGEVP